MRVSSTSCTVLPTRNFFMDEAGVVQDGMGRTSGKGLLVIMVHAVTKDGPLVSRDTGDFSDR